MSEISWFWAATGMLVFILLAFIWATVIIIITDYVRRKHGPKHAFFCGVVYFVFSVYLLAYMVVGV